MFGVRAEAVTTKKINMRFPMGQIFMEVASEEAKDELLQELMVHGVQINNNLYERL